MISKKTLIALPNEHLRQPSAKVGIVTSEIKQIISNMKKTTLEWEKTRDHEVGVALAAIQIDVPLKILIIRADIEDTGAIVTRIKQFVYRAHALDKPEMLARILQANGRGPTMIFCRTKRACQQIADDMKERGFKTAAIHGDLGQGARESALKDFKSLKRDILVATDVAARGIDIDGITHVINYQCPEDEKTYVHRIGRTARAGASGIAITFVDWDELTRWSHINQALELGFPEPQETYSSSDHLYADLGIAKGVKSSLSGAQKVDKREEKPKAKKVEKEERPVRQKRERTRTRGAAKKERE